MTENNLDKIVSINILKLMEAKNISQATLAKKLNRDKVTINRWVNGKRTISLRDLGEISKELNVNPSILIDPNTKIEKKIIISN